MKFSFFNPCTPSPTFEECLRNYGAAPLRNVFTEARHEQILRDLSDSTRHPTIEAPAEAGPYKVKQRYRYIATFPEDSIARMLMEECSVWLTSIFQSLSRNPLREPLSFNTLDGHFYPPSDIGIDFHRDGSRYRALIAIIMLSGDGHFLIGENREGKNPVRIVATPRTMIVLRGHGFLGEERDSIQPFHAVHNIRTHRITLSFRMRVPAAPP